MAVNSLTSKRAGCRILRVCQGLLNSQSQLYYYNDDMLKLPTSLRKSDLVIY
jgi:hypothetical protein